MIDAFGECNDAKMKAQTKLSMFGETAYKCDCQHEIDYETRNDVYKDCEWTVASDLEKTLNDPCTANRAWNDVKTFSKAPKKDVYYCETTVEAFYDVKEVHDWTEMTAAAWCSNNWDYTQRGHNEAGSDYASAICKGNPVDHHTYIYTNSTDGGGLRTAEVFFTVLNYLSEEISCAGNKKYITSLTNTKDDYPNETFYHYEGSNGQPGPLVNDFICKEGYLVEASGVQEACNAAFEKTEICTYMNEQYEHNGSGWVKMNCSTLHDLENNREQKRDFVCTASDGSEYFKAESWTDDYRLDPVEISSSRYNDRWYDVSDYCATKGDHCYKEGQEPQGESSSFICEFVRRHMEKEVFYCDQTDGVWKKDLVTSADDYCNRKLKMEYGIVSCSSDNVEAFCQGKPGDSGPCSNGWFTFSCIPPSDLTPMEGCSAEMQYQCSGEVGSTEFHLNCL